MRPACLSLLGTCCLFMHCGLLLQEQTPDETDATLQLAATLAAAQQQALDLTNVAPAPNDVQRTLAELESGHSLLWSGTENTRFLFGRKPNGQLAAYPINFLGAHFAQPSQTMSLLPELDLTLDISANSFSICLPPLPIGGYQDLGIPLAPPKTSNELLDRGLAVLALVFISGIPDLSQILLETQVRLTHKVQTACFTYSWNDGAFSLSIDAQTNAHFYSSHTFQALDHKAYLQEYDQVMTHRIQVLGRIQNGNANIEDALWDLESTWGNLVVHEEDTCHVLFLTFQCVDNNLRVDYLPRATATLFTGQTLQLDYGVEGTWEAKLSFGKQPLPAVSGRMQLHF